MKTRSAWLLRAVALGVLLSGCATTHKSAANQCLGPPSYCNVYFGS